jgi:DNA-binding transcriptional MerR regulator
MDLTIGALAKKAGVNLETVRYYERRGLLSPKRRTAKAYRVYDEGSLRKLQSIRRAQGLGFSLKEILELLRLEAPIPGACGRVMAKAKAKVAQIREKREALRRMEETLGRLIEDRRCGKTSKGCPALSCFSERGEANGYC